LIFVKRILQLKFAMALAAAMAHALHGLESRQAHEADGGRFAK
jgi:hypothetical protein